MQEGGRGRETAPQSGHCIENSIEHWVGSEQEGEGKPDSTGRREGLAFLQHVGRGREPSYLQSEEWFDSKK